MGWDGLGWDELGWEMGWDGMNWVGMNWVGKWVGQWFGLDWGGMGWVGSLPKTQWGKEAAEEEIPNFCPHFTPEEDFHCVHPPKRAMLESENLRPKPISTRTP